MEKDFDVIVIGGGASGMFAAAIAGKHGARVLLIEKNKRLGEKLRITGGGRCNITNAEDNMRTLLSHYGSAGKYLYSAFSRYGVDDTRRFFASIGVPTKVEDRQRVFPVSDSAHQVAESLVSYLRKQHVTVKTGTAVDYVAVVAGRIASVQVGAARLKASNFIFSTGGLSRPETGSTGDGFAWLERAGHHVRPPTPNVTPLATKEKWVQLAQGVSVKDAHITFFADTAMQFSAHGSILFTHFGLSGPTILNVAYKVSDLLQSGTVVTARIDCFPHEPLAMLDARLAGLLVLHKHKSLRNTIRFVAPPGLSKLVCHLAAHQIDLDQNNSQLSKEHRLVVTRLLKSLPLTIDHLMGFEKAVVADGGLQLDEIDTRTMRSKKISNLFVTGDLLDINRPSGGYSLQLCWTTGYIAGINAATKPAE